MYVNAAARYNAWLPQNFSYRKATLLASAFDRLEYMKDVLYHLPLLCHFRKQVQLDTPALDVGVYFIAQFNRKGMWSYNCSVT